MLTKVNKYIKEKIKNLNTKDQREVINFATFLRRQEKEGGSRKDDKITRTIK